MSIRPRSTQERSSNTRQKRTSKSAIDYVTHIIPASVVGAFAEGEILLFAAVRVWSLLGETATPRLRRGR